MISLRPLNRCPADGSCDGRLLPANSLQPVQRSCPPAPHRYCDASVRASQGPNTAVRRSQDVRCSLTPEKNVSRGTIARAKPPGSLPGTTHSSRSSALLPASAAQVLRRFGSSFPTAKHRRATQAAWSLQSRHPRKMFHVEQSRELNRPDRCRQLTPPGPALLPASAAQVLRRFRFELPNCQSPPCDAARTFVAV